MDWKETNLTLVTSAGNHCLPLFKRFTKKCTCDSSHPGQLNKTIQHDFHFSGLFIKLRFCDGWKSKDLDTDTVIETRNIDAELYLLEIILIPV